MSTLAEELARRGTVSRTFGERLDSRATIVGLETRDGDRIVVKHAVDAEAVGWLQSAVAVPRGGASFGDRAGRRLVRN